MKLKNINFIVEKIKFFLEDVNIDNISTFNKISSGNKYYDTLLVTWIMIFVSWMMIITLNHSVQFFQN